MSEDDTACTILDFGSYNTKYGFLGDEEPCILPSIGGYPKGLSAIAHYSNSRVSFGDIITSSRGLYKIKYPIINGCITDYDYFASFTSFILFNELRIQPEYHPIYLTQNIYTPNKDKEHILQILFEDFNVPSISFGIKPYLSMTALYLSTGVILQCGHDITTVCCMNKGYCIKSSIIRENYGGNNVSEYLVRLLRKKGYIIDPIEYCLSIENIKKKYTFVLPDNSKSNINVNKQYEFCDKRTISLGNELYQCLEGLFKPYLFGLRCKGVVDLIYDSIMSCDISLRTKLFNNIILAGGSTLYPGFEDRLHNELLKMNNNISINIIATENRNILSWIGASINTIYTNNWISKDEYDEFGPSIVHKKCF